jgi:hypothetical protein
MVSLMSHTPKRRFSSPSVGAPISKLNASCARNQLYLRNSNGLLETSQVRFGSRLHKMITNCSLKPKEDTSTWTVFRSPSVWSSQSHAQHAITSRRETVRAFYWPQPDSTTSYFTHTNAGIRDPQTRTLLAAAAGALLTSSPLP